jgi:hypothetical protein
MHFRRRSVLKLLSASAAAVATSGLQKARRAFASPCRVIERDVCVLGGGSSGTFSAVRLRDSGKSVVLLERKHRLGGHTETFRDPGTGLPVDYGVVVFHDLPVVNAYFARLGVPTFAISPADLGGPSASFDFRTGTQLTGYTPPSPAAQGQALGTYFGYLQQLKATYYDLDSGFDLPQPVPPDLLMPFGEFVTKYSLQAMVNMAFSFGQGLGDFLALPAVYVLKNFSAQVLSSIFANRFLVCPIGNGALYDAAAGVLGDDVLYGAELEEVDRRHGGVTLRVETPHGRAEVRCKKLLVTCPPTLDNLRVLELDALERETFGRFTSSSYYTGLVRLSGVPAGLAVTNLGAATLYHLPPLPGIYGLNPSQVPGLWNVKYGSPTRLPDAEVKRRIVADIERLHDPVLFPTRPRVTEFATFAGHNPFELRVSADRIAAGFYTTLGSLQGRNRTYYNGAAFHPHDSSVLWQFTDSHVLPLLLA